MFLLSCFLFLTEPNLRLNLDELDIQLWPRYFNSGHRIAVSNDHHMMVIDPSEQQMVLIPPSSQTGIRIGRRGQGPGEFKGLDSITWLDIEQVFVASDRKNRRISIWKKDGTLVREYAIAESLRNPLFLSADTYCFMRKFSEDQSTFLRAVRRQESLAQEQIFYEAKRRRRQLNVGWDPTLVFGVDSQIMALNDGTKPIIEILDLKTGQKRGQFEIKVKRVPIADSYFQNYVARTRDINPELVKHISRPDFWPYTNKILIDSHQRIWVFLHQQHFGESTDFYVYDQSGELLFTNEIMGWAQAICGDQLYMVHADEDEELFLCRYAISKEFGIR